MRTKLRNAAGFTLVELLLVVTILGMFVVAASRYYSPNRLRMQQGSNSAQEIVQMLRSARNYAVSGESVEIDGEEQTPDGGFGFYFDTNEREAFVFADTDANGQYDLNPDGEPLQTSSAIPDYLNITVSRTENPVGGTATNDLISTEVNPNDFWIVFAPNSAVVTFGSAKSDITIDEDTKEFEIELQLADLRTWTIEINNISRFFEIDIE